MPAAGEHLSAPVKGCSGTQRAKVKRSRLVLSLLAVYAVQRQFPAQWKMVVCNQQKPTVSFSKNADGYVVRQRNNRDEKQKINCTRGISITGENGDISATTTQTDGSAYSIMTIRRICTTAAVCAALSRFRESLCQSNPSRRNPRRKQAIDSIWSCAVWDSHLTDWPSKAWSVFFYYLFCWMPN